MFTNAIVYHCAYDKMLLFHRITYCMTFCIDVYLFFFFFGNERLSPYDRVPLHPFKMFYCPHRKTGEQGRRPNQGEGRKAADRSGMRGGGIANGRGLARSFYSFTIFFFFF